MLLNRKLFSLHLSVKKCMLLCICIYVHIDMYVYVGSTLQTLYTYPLFKDERSQDPSFQLYILSLFMPIQALTIET